MLHLRHFVARSTLRAVCLASASLLVVGAAALAVRAEAAPVAAVQSAFTSDRLSVEVTGSGPDVILIPGLASSREVWRAAAERLKATHRVHLVQLAGFAGETISTAPTSTTFRSTPPSTGATRADRPSTSTVAL